MSHLYLIDSDVKVGYSQGEAVVTSLADGRERRLPFAELEDVSVFGMAQLSTRFVRECISSGVPVLYYSEDGHYFGRTSSGEHVNPARQKRQVLLTDDPDFCLAWAKTVVDAKIRNSLALSGRSGPIAVSPRRTSTVSPTRSITYATPRAWSLCWGSRIAPHDATSPPFPMPWYRRS